MGRLVENYRAHEERTAAGADTDLIGYPVPRNHTALLTFMSIVDYTTENKKLALGIMDAGSNKHYLKIGYGTAIYQTEHSLTIESPLVLLPGEKPFGTVFSATASNVIHFTAHGGLYAMETAEAS